MKQNITSIFEVYKTIHRNRNSLFLFGKKVFLLLFLTLLTLNINVAL